MANVRHRCPRPGCTGRGCTRGAWHWQSRLKGARPKTGSAPTKTQAEQDAADYESLTRRQLREGTYSAVPPVTDRTLGQLVDVYLKDVLPRADRNKDADTITQRLGWWKFRLGKTPLALVTSELVNVCKKELGNGRSKATVNRYLAALSAAYQGVIREENWKVTNPVRGVSRWSEAIGAKKIFGHTDEGGVGRYLDPEVELPRLLEATSKNRQLHLAVVLSLATGGRQSEIFSLRWPYITLLPGREQVLLLNVKNGESRAVPIANGKLLRPVELLHWEPRRIETNVLFPVRGDGEEWSVELTKKPWRKALEEAGIENFRWHDLRHTAASYMVMGGVELRDLMQIMGWKTMSMAMRYVHLSPKHVRGAVERFMASY